MAFDLTPPFKRAPDIRVMYNIGALFDIPTGEYIFGKHGESLLNGGLSPLTGVVGIGNNFKTTIADYFALSTLNRYNDSTYSKYDTELNVLKSRQAHLAESFETLRSPNNPVDTGRYIITDKEMYWANEWYEEFKKFSDMKVKAMPTIIRITPFVDKDKKNTLVSPPTIQSVDSFTKFETQDVADISEANELGDSGANTIFMRQGVSKKRFLSDIPTHIAKSNSPMILVAHVGKTINMDLRAPPVVKLKYLKNGDTLKGVTDDFTFLTTVCWQCQNTTPYINDGTKGPEYPKDSNDDMKGDTDLNLVTLVLLRNKSGRSGLAMQILVSQQDGVLPSLSEFHYLKTNDRYGFEGNDRNYNMALLPDVKLSRTTVRGKLDSDPMLRRAMNISSEMCQIFMLWTTMEKYRCTPKEMYDTLKEKGYDWNILLKTRGYWTFNNEDPDKLPYLSTKDLLRMMKDEYFPFWMNADKSVKKEYREVMGLTDAIKKA